MSVANVERSAQPPCERLTRRRMRILALSAGVLLCGLGAVVGRGHWRSINWSTEPIVPGLGNHSWTITTSSPVAQKYFDQGLAYLWGFNHEAAIRSFEAAAANDSQCAMAFWGIALAHGPDINFTDVNKEHGRAAWASLAKACALAPSASESEKALVAALCERYDDPLPADQQELSEAYAQAMLKVQSSFPQDTDIGSLTVESLLICTPLGKPTPRSNAARAQMIEILDDVLARDPHHLLALHLMIHVCENSPWLEKAKQAAETLRERSPGLGHLLHMPSHADIRVGQWREAVVANEKAIAADQAYLRTGPKIGRYQNYINHSSHMLAFAALMCGQRQKAEQTTRDLALRLYQERTDKRAAKNDGYVALAYEVEIRFGRWDAILAEPEPPDRFPTARALWRYARGIAYAAKKNVALAKVEQKAFTTARTAVSKDATFRKSSAQEILGVAEKMLAGEILYRDHQTDDAVSALREGVLLEETLHGLDPPDWMLPVRHVLGATLMDCGRYAEAETVYRNDLAKYPENGWSLYGLTQSLKMQGKKSEAMKTRARFDKAWADADFHLPSSCCCLPSRDKPISN